MGLLRVVVPDSHGSYADGRAVGAFLADLKLLDPKEIVLLGDHVDVGGVFSTHPRNYLEDMQYSYEEDCKATNQLLDEIQKRAPKAQIHYLEGNHEQHLERWVARTFANKQDADGVLRTLSPEAKLELRRRGIRYYRSDRHHMGLSVRGSIRLGKCHFIHGYRAGKYATAAHLDDFGANVVHGHTHRAQSVIRRTVASGEIGSWCPGTLAQLQPLYQHTAVSAWSHGYALQLVGKDGGFLHVNVPITRGKSLLRPMLDLIGKKARR